MSITVAPTSAENTVIKVIGVGGAGGNAVRHMVEKGFAEVDFICANTDAQALAKTGATQQLKLGDTGLGAGANPEVGADAAREAKKRIVELLQGAHMVFVTAGMGGGTGTGAAPVIAEIAKEMGILTVGVVTKPFGFEGARRSKQAVRGIQELAKSVNSLVVVLNDKLLEVLGDDVTQKQAFEAADDVLYNAVAGITEIIKSEGVVNVDFEDVRTVMGSSGRAMMGYGICAGAERARKAAEDAIACPLLEGVNLASAKGVLVNVTASSATLRMKEASEVMEVIHGYVDEDATIIYGAVYDDDMGDELRVTVVATGLEDAVAAKAPARPAPRQVPTLTDAVATPVLRGPTPTANQDPWAEHERPAVFRNGRGQGLDVNLDVPASPAPAAPTPPAPRQRVMPSANARGGLGPVAAPRTAREAYPMERAEPALERPAAAPSVPATVPARLEPAQSTGSWFNEHIPGWLKKRPA